MLFGLAGFSPASLAVLLISCVLILVAPRKWMMPTFLIASFFVSMLPHVMIFGQSFMVHRALVTFAWIRLMAAGEHRTLQLSAMDKAFIAFSVWTVIGDTFLFMGSKAMVYQIANSIWDAMGTYFLCRILLNDATEMRRAIICLAWVCIGLAGFMMIEFVTHRNLLSVLGALHETVQVREGKLRCQASSSVPITAGTFGAVLLPLFVACWWQGPELKKWALRGAVAATVITVTASSGGPLMTYAAVLLGLVLWPLRKQMRAVRWTIWITLIVLHIVMKAPVWALIARIKVVPGNSGFHRFQVLDTFIRQFPEWWMLGVKTTENWGGLLDDVANQYCVVAKHGGLLAVILFIRVIVIAFREVGIQRRAAEGNRGLEILMWSFGVMLWGHCVSFIGISYFDQTKVLWFLCLAMLASAHLLVNKQEKPAEESVEADTGVANPVTTGTQVSAF